MACAYSNTDSKQILILVKNKNNSFTESNKYPLLNKTLIIPQNTKINNNLFHPSLYSQANSTNQTPSRFPLLSEKQSNQVLFSNFAFKFFYFTFKNDIRTTFYGGIRR